MTMTPKNYMIRYLETPANIAKKIIKFRSRLLLMHSTLVDSNSTTLYITMRLKELFFCKINVYKICHPKLGFTNFE